MRSNIINALHFFSWWRWLLRLHIYFYFQSERVGDFFLFSASVCFLLCVFNSKTVLSPTVSLKTRTWIRSRRPSVSARGGWLTTPVNALGCETSTRPSRSWAACASCTWKARSPKLNCSSSIRLWPSYLTWSSKSEVRVHLSFKLALLLWLKCQRYITSNQYWFFKMLNVFT